MASSEQDYSNGMVDLGKEYDGPMMAEEGSSSKKIDYPTLYIRGIEQNPNFPKGEFYAVIKVKAVSVTEREAHDDDGDEVEGEPDIDYDCELEVHGIKVLGEAKTDKPSKKTSDQSLDEAFDGIAKNKAKKAASAMDEEEGGEDDTDNEEEESQWQTFHSY